MSTGAIIMMVFGLTLTWGGAAVCIAIAVRRQRL